VREGKGSSALMVGLRLAPAKPRPITSRTALAVTLVGSLPDGWGGLASDSTAPCCVRNRPKPGPCDW
jgi:hypothetical protein